MTQLSVTNNTISRLPLAVAVTGHRDIAPADEPRLRDLVRGQLEKLRQTYPSTPLLALSGLAEGADMVFAEAALDLDIELMAVLPAEPDIFAKDFETPAHPDRNPEDLRRRFEALLARCIDVVVAGEGRLASEPQRYTFVGAYLVRRCHILFALWDGTDSGAEGGTSHVVRLAQEGVPNRYRKSFSRVLDAPDSITVYHLRTPRRGVPLQEAFTWNVIEPSICHVTACCQSKTLNSLDELEMFNAAAINFTRDKSDTIAQSRQYIKIGDRELKSAERRILGAFVLADAMAGELQKQSRRALNSIYMLSCIMLLLFAIHSNVYANRAFYLLYFFAFALGGGIYFYEKKQRIYARFVDYRGLAEGLRVQLFFRLASVRAMAADLYLRKQRAELVWIRQAMRVLEVGVKRKDPLADSVLNGWIRDQAGYFNKTLRDESHDFRGYSRAVNTGFLLGLFVSAIGLCLELVNPAMHDSVWLHWAFMLMGLFPAFGALAGSYAYRRGFGEHIREYSKMGEMFCRAAAKVEEGNLSQKPFAFRNLTLELGKEALAESAQWVLRHRELPPDLPSK